MSIPQKFIPPDIARDELTPRELELLAVLTLTVPRQTLPLIAHHISAALVGSNLKEQYLHAQCIFTPKRG